MFQALSHQGSWNLILHVYTFAFFREKAFMNILHYVFIGGSKSVLLCCCMLLSSVISSATLDCVCGLLSGLHSALAWPMCDWMLHGAF